MSTKYTGHCNHKMIHKILKEHEKDLKEHEKEALKALRTKIHDIIKGVDNIEITIYLDDIDPITVKQGAGENELVIQFSKNSDKVDFAWVQKTVSQRLYEAVTGLAWNVVEGVCEVLRSIFTIAKEAITGAARQQITWEKKD